MFAALWTFTRSFRLSCVVAALVASTPCLAAAPSIPPPPAGGFKNVAVIADPGLGDSGKYGVRKLEEALRAKQIAVTRDEGQAAAADVVLIAGLGNGTGPAATALAETNVTVPPEKEALVVRKGTRYKSKPAIVLAGADETGLMYAALDLASRISWAGENVNPFQQVRDVTE